MPSKSRTTHSIKAKKAKGSSSTRVSAWIDDPESKLGVIERPTPNLSKAPLKYKFRGPAVPAQIYPQGTPQRSEERRVGKECRL